MDTVSPICPCSTKQTVQPMMLLRLMHRHRELLHLGTSIHPTSLLRKRNVCKPVHHLIPITPRVNPTKARDRVSTVNNSSSSLRKRDSEDCLISSRVPLLHTNNHDLEEE